MGNVFCAKFADRPYVNESSLMTESWRERTEMDDTLSDLFVLSEGLPIDLGGVEARPLFESTVAQTDCWLVSLSSGRDDVDQGIMIRAVGGKIHVGGDDLVQPVLWVSTAPPLIDIGFVPQSRDSPMKVRVFNIWTGHRGVTQRSLGNSGIVVSQSGDSDVVLNCSSGIGPVNFDDLIVTIEMAGGDTAT